MAKLEISPEWKESRVMMVVSGVQQGIVPDITKAEVVNTGGVIYRVYDAGQGVSYVWSTGAVFLVNGCRMPDQGVSYVFVQGDYFIRRPFMVFSHELLPDQRWNPREPTRTCQCQGSEQVMRPVDCDHIKAVKKLGQDKPHQLACKSYPMAHPCLRIILAQL